MSVRRPYSVKTRMRHMLRYFLPFVVFLFFFITLHTIYFHMTSINESSSVSSRNLIIQELLLNCLRETSREVLMNKLIQIRGTLCMFKARLTHNNLYLSIHIYGRFKFHLAIYHII